MGLDFLDNCITLEHALACAEFGKFHYSLLALCGLIYLNCAVSASAVSFVLPSAQCDFSLSSSDKGLLNAVPLFGMLLGAYFWGCLADMHGRKRSLIAALLLDGVSSLASSALTFFWPFLVCRFLSGFGLSGYLGICYPYLGEFQPKAYRERVLSWMETFWTAGIILVPAVAWSVIPMTTTTATTAVLGPVFRYSSWNAFLTLCSLPSIALAAWLTRFPESPKFLFECGEFGEALECLRRMYAENTGWPGHAYPVASLDDRDPRCADHGAAAAAVQSKRSLRDVKTVRTTKDLVNLADEVWHQTGEMFRPPHRSHTVITCLVQFGLTSSYYTLVMWFPELFNRFDRFEARGPAGADASVCQVSSAYTTHAAAGPCDAAVGGSVYAHTLYLGLACVPLSLLMPLLVHRVGAKWFLVTCLLVSGAASAALYFVRTAAQNLALSCLFEAFSSLGASVLMVITVDLFPTNMRVMAAAASATVGRLGSLMANIVFGLLIDTHCALLIALFSALLVASGLLSLALPNSGGGQHWH